MSKVAIRTRLVGVSKQLWNQYPEHVCAGVAATVASLACFTKMYFYYKNGGNNKRYKRMPVYMRPDDPRVPFVHKD